MADERVGLKLQVTGQEDYTRAAGKVAQLEKELADLQVQLSRGSGSAEGLRRELALVTAELEQARAAAARTSQAFEREARATENASIASQQYAASIRAGAQANATAATAVAGAGKAVRDSGNAAGFGALKWLLLAQTVEDAQYGFTSVVNNLPLLVMAFGGGPGLAAAVSLSAVGIALLSRNVSGLGNVIDAQRGKDLLARVGLTPERLGWAQRQLGSLGNGLKNFVRGATGGVINPEGGAIARARAVADAADKQAQEQAEANARAVEAIPDAEKQRLGQAFTRIVSEQGGGKAIEDQIFARRTAGLTEAQLGNMVGRAGGRQVSVAQSIREQIQAELARAAEGDTETINRLAPDLGQDFARQYLAEGPFAEQISQVKATIDDYIAEIGRASDAETIDGLLEAFQVFNGAAVALAGRLDTEIAGKLRDLGRAVDESRARIEQEAMARADAIVSKQAEAELSRQAAERERRNERDAGLAQQMGMDTALAGAMLNAAARGEDAGETDARLRGQVEAALVQRGVDPRRAGDVASRLVGTARQGIEDAAAQRQMLDPMATPEGRLQAMLEGQGGRFAQMQAQLFMRANPAARQALARDQVLRQISEPGEMRGERRAERIAELEQRNAETMKDAVDRFRQAVEQGIRI